MTTSILRADLGDDPNAEIKIKGLNLRPMNEQERHIAAVRDAKKMQDVVLEENLKAYLGKEYRLTTDKVLVSEEKIETTKIILISR